MAPSKPSCVAQDLAQPARREAGRPLVDARIDHVRRHHARERPGEPFVGPRVVAQDALERAVVDRDLEVAVGAHEAMAGEVLAAVVHARLQQAEAEALRQQRDDARIAMERAIADHAARAVVEVEHRREAEVDAAGAQLGAEHMAGSARRLERAHRAGAAAAGTVVHPHLAEHAHRRQRGEAVGAEALHAAALVVDADEQVGADRLRLGDQLGELAAVAASCGRTGSGRRSADGRAGAGRRRRATSPATSRITGAWTCFMTRAPVRRRRSSRRSRLRR